MDPLKNPFSPGAGSPPPELAGRKQILDRAKLTFDRLKAGRSEKSFLLVGLRGVGKTVLLNEISRLAESSGYKSILLEAHEKKSLAALLLPSLRNLLFQLDRIENFSEKVKRSFRVLKSFFNGVKLKVQEVELSLDVDPEVGTADSGDLESDLPFLFESIFPRPLTPLSEMSSPYLSERKLSKIKPVTLGDICPVSFQESRH